ncbi:Putative peptidoglycan-binding domain-containing protein [Vibrio nigripulchritudo SOn1]|uniref:Peptidoglycan-binding domain-containing protein n=1 Tax=Vibrio nigripulchritudo SOn1 TaxID=1238450 RepID=A0AAV2VVG0_9VIBR|nr:N-acetylmuramoyl-L-alanine amidase [Vibrio nigripulchritudo]CCO48612.1 Putative peptidoglycan-binding domain-containing protein [Vibrio nigripulchritudo SOn1]
MSWSYGDAIVFNKPNRNVHSVFLHCSASDRSQHDSIAVIDKWHKKRGFSEIGYHYFISKNGDIHIGRNIEKIPAAQKGHNTGSIAICLHGLKKENFTEKQFTSVRALCMAIDSAYGSKTIKFRGHCEVSSKSCPVFDYKSVLKLDTNRYIDTSKSNTQSITKGIVAAAKNVLDLFSSGEKVKELQRFLNEAGYPTKVDGVYGQSTKANIEIYQRSNGLYVDGIAGPKTLLAMGTLKLGCKGSAVKLLQRQLTVKGYKCSDDGKFGLKTEKNVKGFQKAKRLGVDGIVGKTTKRKLFGTVASQKLA